MIPVCSTDVVFGDFVCIFVGALGGDVYEYVVAGLFVRDMEAMRVDVGVVRAAERIDSAFYRGELECVD